MLNIFTKKSWFGLDISDLSLKAVELEKDKNSVKLKYALSSSIPGSFVKKGEIKNERGLAEAIKDLVSKAQGGRIKNPYVACSLPEEKSFIDVIKLPALTEKEAKEAVKYEIENYIPLSLEEVYFDAQVIKQISNHKKVTEVLVVAAPKNLVNSYLKTLKMASLKPMVFEIECQSIARAVVKKETSQKNLLIIDFGKTRTTFVIFSGKSIRFTSTIPVSSKKLTREIAKKLSIGMKKAEELKRNYGIEEKKELFETMLPTLNELVEQIRVHLEYWRSSEKRKESGYQGKTLGKILLCGGGANLRGLAGFLIAQLNIPVEFADPWINILPLSLRTESSLPLTAEESLSYTTALGLALRGLNKK